MRFSSMETERKLEDVITHDISIIDPALMLVGRQIGTAFGKFIDILAIDQEGNLVVIELKRNKTPREVVAQMLDYASWVKKLDYNDIITIYAEKNPGRKLEQDFTEHFQTDLPDSLNDVRICGSCGVDQNRSEGEGDLGKRDVREPELSL